MFLQKAKIELESRLLTAYGYFYSILISSYLKTEKLSYISETDGALNLYKWSIFQNQIIFSSPNDI